MECCVKIEEEGGVNTRALENQRGAAPGGARDVEKNRLDLQLAESNPAPGPRISDCCNGEAGKSGAIEAIVEREEAESVFHGVGTNQKIGKNAARDRV